MAFVHLHVHTHFSLLDSPIQVPRLVQRAKELGMPAVAVTDHCNLFGAVEFAVTARKAGLKPIIGCEVQVQGPYQSPNHLVLLAATQEGYFNLCNLVTRSHLEKPNPSERPVVRKEWIREAADGLFALSGCLAGEVPQAILREDQETLESSVRFYHDLFGDRFYLEVQANDLEEQQRVNQALRAVGDKYGIPLVATNDVHYLDRKDAILHAVLMAIEMKRSMTEDQRRAYGLNSFNFKAEAHMREALRGFEDALEHTLEIAEQVDDTILAKKPPLRLPIFETPDGSKPGEYLRRVAEQGLADRAEQARAKGEKWDMAAYEERLRKELDIIVRMGFDSYYLIVWDFVKWAKANGIPVGPARGSGGGSLVAYCIGITEIDPLRYNLLFERFLNPERVNPPDFDIDFCAHRRDRVIEYVAEKYGRENVGQIITMTEMKARAAIKDVGRVLGMPFSETDRITKLIPNTARDLTEALEQEPRLQKLLKGRDADPKLHELWDIATGLEGVARQPGKHPAGVVLADRPLTEYVPLHMNQDGSIVTQFAMKDLDQVGLVKFDMLSLSALTIIDEAVSLIRARKDPGFSVDQIPEDDPATYRLLAEGRTAGVFQLESSGITKVVKRLRPDSLEDLTALLALYRPGPLGGGMVDDFIQRKHGFKPIEYPLPELEPVLKETYGVILYQEQVMLIAATLAGFTLGQADLLRRAMGKKKMKELMAQREPFIEGAVRRGIEKKKAEDLFEKLLYFASYGFNKSHSAAYAVLTYRTAYLKANYPAEFLCALLTCEKGNQDKVMMFLREARDMGVPVQAPHVNKSGPDFTVEDLAEGRSAIRFGLSAVKGVGASAVKAIMEARKDGPFEGPVDFVSRIDGRRVNRKVMVSLAKAGAFDSFGYSRRALVEGISSVLEQGQARRAVTQGGQASLFDEVQGKVQPMRIQALPEWDETNFLRHEREALGYYVSRHPMEQYRERLKLQDLWSVKDLAYALEEGVRDVMVAGVVTTAYERKSKQGNSYAAIQLDDGTGQLECLVFQSVFDQWQRIKETVEPIWIRGHLEGEGDEEPQKLRVRVRELRLLSEVKDDLVSAVVVNLDLGHSGEDIPGKLARLFEQYKGGCRLEFRVSVNGVPVLRAVAGPRWKVDPSEALVRDVEDLLGPGSIALA